ncbi:hypothetical protein [Mycobacterium arosiense]|uniref:Uncharacterized protein n=1 Tax=Mycobacterium arosiense ATCC BAA-1401 = DSM 45069 TaxID=1265311 RepID=A0A1W9Z649_MYCAI|nr:hypothetical protein [Mycobacterium arosiense]ORA07667.1 hypothetical protein BST14_26795 [Mycobacterium arosiense ATCC BAA-1401 = DSM 45069]
MITRPTCQELIEAVRRELGTTVIAAVTDASVQGTLAMIDAVLQIAAARSEHELTWMTQETDATESFAEHIIGAGVDGCGPVRDGLAKLREARGTDNQAAGVLAAYHASGRLLAACTELALSCEGDIRARLDQVLLARLENELEIRGEFRMAGRG